MSHGPVTWVLLPILLAGTAMNGQTPTPASAKPLPRVGLKVSVVNERSCSLYPEFYYESLTLQRSRTMGPAPPLF
jgi:hypothetical protein